MTAELGGWQAERPPYNDRRRFLIADYADFTDGEGIRKFLSVSSA